MNTLEDSPLINAMDGVTRILICCSGSVATLKIPEIVTELKNKCFDVRVVCSKASLHFFKAAKQYDPLVWEKFETCGGETLVYTDEDEWSIWSKIGDPVLHIDLSLWADIVLVAPASADIIAKINAGISDTLLLSVLRAWNFKKPCILCPAMNTMMWEHPITEQTLTALDSLGWRVINPVTKTLACNVVGIGAMAHVKDIVSHIEKIVTDWDELEVEKYSDGNTSRTLPIKNRRSSVIEEAVRIEQRDFFQYFLSEGIYYLAAFFCLLIIIRPRLLNIDR